MAPSSLEKFILGKIIEFAEGAGIVKSVYKEVEDKETTYYFLTGKDIPNEELREQTSVFDVELNKTKGLKEYFDIVYLQGNERFGKKIWERKK